MSLPRTRVSREPVAAESRRKRLGTAFSIIALIALMTANYGCSVLGNPAGPAQTNQDIQLSLSPTSLDMRPGAQQSFSATVRNTADTRVRWTASAGSISTDGVFIAPAAEATVHVTITSLADPARSASADVNVAHAPSPLQISTRSIPVATSGTPYATPVSADGGRSPYRWTLDSNSLPAGLAWGSSGLISGTTEQTGSFPLTLRVVDASGAIASRTLTLVVNPRAQTGNYDGPAELPRIYMQTTVADTPSPGPVVKVKAGGDLQGALDAASCGDTVMLQAGAVFNGNYRLPAKPCDDAHWITVRTSASDTNLPAEGTRISPCNSGVNALRGRPLRCSSTKTVTAKIVGFPPLEAAPGSHYYRLIGLELTQIPGQFAYSILNLSDSSHHVVVDRCWVHGTATDDSQIGVRFNSGYLTLVDSFVSDIHYVGTDSQAVSGAGGTGPYKIVNNFLEGAGENIMFGGGAATTSPADIEIRFNHLYKPLTWMPGNPAYAGIQWTVKDLFELKNGQRLLLEGNIFENAWGTPIVITPKNQENRCPVCVASDLTFRFNIVRHAAVALGVANAPSDAGGLSRGAQFISVHDDLFDDISRVKWAPGASGWMFYLGACARCTPLHDVSMKHLTVVSTNNSFLFFGGDNPVRNLTFTDNIVQNGLYGSPGCGPTGTATIDICAPGADFRGNVIVGGTAATYPRNNSFPAAWSSLEFSNFRNGNGGNYELLPNSPYYSSAPGANINVLNSKTAGVSQW